MTVPPRGPGPNGFLVDLVTLAEERGWWVTGWSNGKVAEITLTSRPISGGVSVTLRADYGLNLEEYIAALPRGDGREGST